MRKTLTLVVALLMLVQLLAACGTTPSDGTDTTAAPGTTAAPETTLPPETEPPKPEIPAIDGKGENFNILSRKPDGSFPNAEFIVNPDLAGETLNEAVAKRNRIIEDKYKVKIVASEAATADVRTAVQQQIASQDTTYDLVLPTIRNAFVLALEGALYNVDDIPYVTPDSPWYDSLMMKNFSVGNNNFMLLSDMNLQNFNAIAVVYYNHKVAETNNIPNIYQVVRDGKWTIDTMHEYCTAVTRDLDGDGIIKGGDQFGLITGNFAWQAMFYGSGETFTIKDNNDISALNWDSEKNINVITKMTKFLNDENAVAISHQRKDLKGSADTFTQNEALFFIEYIYTLPKVRNMDTEFGMLPPPKYDENQDNYYTALHTSHSSSTVVPTTNNRMELTGAIIEDMAYQSKEIIRPAFYDITLTGKYVRNEDTVEMLDLIYANINTDLTLGMATSGLTIDKVMRAIYTEDRDEFVSAIQADKELNAKIMKDNADKLVALGKK